jgi:hypothetical protein
MKARNIAVTDDGFVMDVPKHMPGERSGSASLSFQGAENFIGKALEREGRLHLTVERALPILPLLADPKELWAPKPNTYEALMGRLTPELKRRNQPLPTIPAEKPTPTLGARRRKDRLSRMSTSAGPRLD